MSENKDEGLNEKWIKKKKKRLKTDLKDQGKNDLFVGYCRQGAFSSHIV